MSIAVAPTTPGGFGELPSGWAAHRIPAGVWLYEEPMPAAARAAELDWIAPDPARPVVVVDGTGRSALDAASSVLGALFDQGGLRRVRLALPELSPRTAQRFADRHSLDLVATPGLLRIHRSYLYTWGFSAARAREFWQWFRFVPGRRPEPFGAIYPPAAWETPLLAGVPSSLAGLSASRIASGVALLPPGSGGADFMAHAARIQPDPSRLTVAVSSGAGEETILAAVRELMETLPAASRRGVRLVCSGLAASPGIGELARMYAAELLAPSAEIAQTGTGALLVSGPAGLGTWISTSKSGTEDLGPLHPVPHWRTAVRDLPGLSHAPEATDSGVSEVPAGLRLHRPDGSSSARLAATVPPDDDHVTIFADGDPSRAADRDALEQLIGRLPDGLTEAFRLVMAHADAGGPRAYGQWLANRFGALVAVARGVPAVAWERTAPGLAVAVGAWHEFRPEDHPFFPPSRLLSEPASRPDAALPPAPVAASAPVAPGLPGATPGPASREMPVAGPAAVPARPAGEAAWELPVAGGAVNGAPQALDRPSWRAGTATDQGSPIFAALRDAALRAGTSALREPATGPSIAPPESPPDLMSAGGPPSGPSAAEENAARDPASEKPVAGAHPPVWGSAAGESGPTAETTSSAGSPGPGAGDHSLPTDAVAWPHGMAVPARPAAAVVNVPLPDVPGTVARGPGEPRSAGLPVAAPARPPAPIPAVAPEPPAPVQAYAPGPHTPEPQRLGAREPGSAARPGTPGDPGATASPGAPGRLGESSWPPPAGWPGQPYFPGGPPSQAGPGVPPPIPVPAPPGPHVPSPSGADLPTPPGPHTGSRPGAPQHPGPPRMPGPPGAPERPGMPVAPRSDGPGAAQDPPAPPPAPGAADLVPVRPVVARGHHSSPDERRRYRERIGSRRDRHMVAVARVLTERPALRGAMSVESEEAVSTDMSALRAYLTGDLPRIDAALRSGDIGDMRADVACCVSALRLLAAYRGPAFRTADLTDAEAACYVPGMALAEPGFAIATSRRPRAEGNTLYAIWSRTARRIAHLTDDDDPQVVMFAAGTAFTVLAAERAQDRWVVHLDERTRPGPSGALTDADRTTLERLRAAAAQEGDTGPRRYGDPLCVDGRRCFVAA